MELGISTASFFSHVVTEDCLDIIRQMDVSTCEIFLTTFSEYEPEFAQLLKSKLNGLKVQSVHSLNTQFEPQLFNIAARTREDAEIMFRKVCSAGQVLGAKSYTFHGMFNVKHTPVNVDFGVFGAHVSHLTDVAAEYGISLAYENVHWAYFSNPEFFTKLVAVAPDIKCTLDIKQAMQSGISWKEYLKVMKGKLVNVHLCDYDEYGKLRLPGKGCFDFLTFFRALKDSGYDGSVIMELYARDYKDNNEVLESVNYLKNILAKC